ncbi:MAG TPA: precorrin-6A synthase (deacetylating) [Solirubrobacteraceae bacterium]|nr:precorrin-6A synthase (deacetylating) [Solirubrobacteraceae bacterium]
MRRVLVVGIGSGDPRHVTVQAIEALNRAAVVFEIERGASELTSAREDILRRHVTGDFRLVSLAEPRRDRESPEYASAVHDWRSRRADVWERAIERELRDGEEGAFLVWGDPSLYDSTIAVLDEVAGRGRVIFTIDVVPGISSIQALTARHGIVLNRVGGAVLITTGRRLSDHGWPSGVDDLVVMLDAGGAFRRVLDHPCDIYWGAYLGTADELLVAGPLHEVADEIDRIRAQARERKGWIMDCYLLRSRATE